MSLKILFNRSCSGLLASAINLTPAATKEPFLPEKVREHSKTFFVVAGFLLLSAFTMQPMDERKAQEALPMSQSPVWQVLQKTKITVDKKRGFYNAKFPAEVKAFSGKEITISGFIMPLESKDKFTHFLLAKRTPTCPFCPPGEPNEIIDVWTVKPVEYTDDSVNVKGRFEFMNDKEMGLFFKLKNAVVFKK